MANGGRIRMEGFLWRWFAPNEWATFPNLATVVIELERASAKDHVLVIVMAIGWNCNAWAEFQCFEN